ncbi:MAG: phenylalanine--tRNA ligase subunit alpha [Thaumarchaeota archaeon]|nr:phenylalanine--tRNA ligase subunit alpha [Nitrososphaerota archaeon]
MPGMVLHIIEKKIISSLRSEPRQSLDRLAGSAGLSLDQARRGVEWLRHKGLAEVSESEEATISLGKNGMRLPHTMLPERRLLDMLLKGGPQEMPVLQDSMGSLFGAAMGIVKRNGWAVTGSEKGRIVVSAAPPKDIPGMLPGEATLRALAGAKGGPISAESVDPSDLESLLRRPELVTKTVTKTKHVSLSEAAGSVDASFDEGREGGAKAGAIDVGADVPAAPRGRRHPLKEVISEIREIFVTMGFSEVSGRVVQPCFWNFDALLTPQDHPSREMQDTFYLDVAPGKLDSTPAHTRRISKAHRDTWHQKWDAAEAGRMVLRTHTTCVTLRHLLQSTGALGDARIFSLGRVFRNEKTSYKHLAEFTQVEGVVHEAGSTIRGLMGIQAEFYRRLGLPKVRFWPTFFPYTEPSFQSMVYNERLGKWVELFGMGIFHPHVTRGLKHPVLAWGGGVERIAMLKYGVDDVREFYANNLGLLRGMRRRDDA